MPISRRDLLAASALISALPGCASSLLSYKRSTITQLASDYEVCAATYAVLRSGRVERVSAISGCTPGAALPEESVFQAASLTKPLAAYAALQLANSGALDLNAAVARYLPGGYTHFQSVLARRAEDPNDLLPATVLAQIPLYTLLNHTSGLPNWSAKPMSPSFAPSTGWQYSGEGYMLLQSVIEAVTGQEFERFVRTQVFPQLGMTNSSMVWTPALESSLQVGQASVLSPRPARFRHPAAAASLYTTAGDFGHFMAGLFSNRAVTALTVNTTAIVDQQLGLRWGLGWGIEQTDHGPLLWQWGNNPGYRSFAMLSPETGDGFVILTSSEKGMPLAVPLAYEVFPTEHNAFRFSMVG